MGVQLPFEPSIYLRARQPLAAGLGDAGLCQGRRTGAKLNPQLQVRDPSRKLMESISSHQGYNRGGSCPTVLWMGIGD